MEAGGSEDNYRIGYYFSNQNDLEAIDESNTFEITSPMNRMAAVNLYVPNIRNDLTVQKLDQNGNLITDGAATFELRPANSDGTYNASASPEQTRVTSMGEATFTAISNGIYYLVETAAPAGYTANTTPAKIIVNDTGIYADAGRANDGISVERSVGRLVNSMEQFASRDTVDTTLNQIVAKFYTTQSEISEGFQWRTINGTGNDAAFIPVARRYLSSRIFRDRGLPGNRKMAFVRHRSGRHSGWHAPGPFGQSSGRCQRRALCNLGHARRWRSGNRRPGNRHGWSGTAC